MLRTPLISLILSALLASGAEKPSLVIGEKIAGMVGFYTDQGKRVAGVKVGTHPHEIVLSADRKQLFVSDNGILWMTNPGEGGNTISIIDIATMTKAGVIDLGIYRRPHGLDVDPKTGRLISTIENPDGLLLIDPAQRKVLRKFDVKGEDPHMARFSPDGKWAFVSNTHSSTIAAVNLSTGDVKLIPTDAGPQGSVYSHDGSTLYLVNSDGKSISIVDVARKERIGRIATDGDPNRIELTPDGKTLVYSMGERHAVGFADVASRKETKVIDIGGRPLSLSMSADGKTAYSGIQDQDKIVILSVPDRKIVRTFLTPKEAGPDPVLPLP